MNNSLIKKFFKFTNSNNDRKYYEEFLAPAIINKNQILDVFIPTHAPNIFGNNIIVNDILDINNCYKPKDFTILDDGCPPGYVNFIDGNYNVDFLVKYSGRYWISNVNTNLGDIPGISSKWIQRIPESKLRKRYKLQLMSVPFSAHITTNPLPIQAIKSQSYIHNAIIIGTSPVLVNTDINTNLNSILLSSLELQTELLDGFLIKYVNGMVNFNTVTIKNIIYNNDNTILVMLYETLNVPLSGTETYVIIPLYGNSPNFLKNSVDFSFDAPYYTYKPYIEKNNGNEIPFGVSDYIIDNDIGMITFYDGIPSNVDSLNPIKVSFYQVIENNFITNNNEIKNNIITNSNVEIFNYNLKDLIYDDVNKLNLTVVYPNKKVSPHINIIIDLDIMINNIVTVDILAIDYDISIYNNTFTKVGNSKLKINIPKKNIIDSILKINSNNNDNIQLEIRMKKNNVNIVNCRNVYLQ
jgi:hypothetical protein